MNLGVGYEVRLPGEGLSADGARERRLPSVKSHVREQGPLLQKLFPADCTRVGYPTVQPAVIDQLEFPLEAHAAVGADERVQAAVEARVHSQVLFLGERFSALLADKGPLSRMELAVRH